MQTALRGVDKIYSTGRAFAAVLQDGMDKIYSTHRAFAAVMIKKGSIKLAIPDSNC